jgi:glutamate-ammonia-ligase adenylyltransferase
MAGLRRAAGGSALLVGLADLGGSWPLERVTAELTRFADAAVRTVVDHLLAEAARRGEFRLRAARTTRRRAAASSSSRWASMGPASSTTRATST